MKANEGRTDLPAEEPKPLLQRSARQQQLQDGHVGRRGIGVQLVGRGEQR